MAIENTRVEKIATGALILVVCAVLFTAVFLECSEFAVQDFSNFWAAAHLASKNPYSHGAVVALEQSEHLPETRPSLVIKNPPWAIVPILPLGFFSYRTAFALWVVFNVIATLACAFLTWRTLKAPDSLTPVLLPLLFGPLLVLIMLGQWSGLVLVGITVFLLMAEQGRDWIAGVPLVLILGKPHIAFLFLLSVALWACQRRRWGIVISGTLALLAASGAALLINPNIFSQFLEHDRHAVFESVPYPNLGGFLYAISGIHSLAIMPQLAGVLWVVAYWYRHRSHWDWKSHGMYVLVASVVCSYYSYPYDEVILLPAILVAFARGKGRAFVIAFIVTDLAYAIYISGIAGHFGFGYLFLWWTALGWAVTYCLASVSFSKREIS